MSPRRAALPVTLLLLAACAPATSAQSLGLEADRPCYGPHATISLTGYGFTPDGDVALSADGQQLGVGMADYDGLFSATVKAPRLPFPQIALRFTATDQTYLLNRASSIVRLTSLGVRVTPTTGEPSRPKRIRARGFFGGRVLYAHIRRGDRVRNLRVGRLTGACRRIDAKRRLFPPGVDPGSYTLHFDTSRRYVAAAGTRISYAVEIAADRSRADAGMARAATRERWTLLSP